MRYTARSSSTFARSRRAINEFLSFYAPSVRIAAESEHWIVTLLIYFYERIHCNYIFGDLFLEISIFVGNFALFHVVCLVFFYLFPFSQEKSKRAALRNCYLLGGARTLNCDASMYVNISKSATLNIMESMANHFWSFSNTAVKEKRYY